MATSPTQEAVGVQGSKGQPEGAVCAQLLSLGLIRPKAFDPYPHVSACALGTAPVDIHVEQLHAPPSAISCGGGVS